MKRLCLLLIGIFFCSFTFSEEPQYKLLDYSAWDGTDDSNNNQNVEVYQPYPIIFIHGFAGGKAGTWNNLINYSTLKDHYLRYDIVNKKYVTIYKPIELKKGTNGYTPDGEFRFLVDENKGRLPYLERMDMLDKNGSIDTYNSGDEITLLNPQKNTDGWADKIKGAIDYALANVNTNSASAAFRSTEVLDVLKIIRLRAFRSQALHLHLYTTFQY